MGQKYNTAKITSVVVADSPFKTQVGFNTIFSL